MACAVGVCTLMTGAPAGSGGLMRPEFHATDPESTAERFRDYAPEIGMFVFADLWSPMRDVNGNEAFPPVTSKWQQPRDQGTTPHQGIDLRGVVNTAIYPVEVGWIVDQSGRLPDGTCCFNGEATPRWEMMILVDWNYNGVQDDELYLKYDHLETVGFLPTGSYVAASDLVAGSGDEGRTMDPHLHFGFLYPKFSGVNNGRWTGMERFFTYALNWRYGRDLDIISFVHHYTDNVVRAYAYVMDDGNYVEIPSGNMHVLHRASGASTWTEAAMQKSGIDPDDWSLDLDALGYAPGTQIHWMMRALRPLSVEPHRAAYFPPRNLHPIDSPNNSPAPSTYLFYSATTQ